jgi:KDO2-lipid IV(A) lauroyltransferase
MGCIFYFLIPIRKKVVLDNLHHAFPDYNEKKIRRIAFGAYKNFSIALIEILYMPKLTRTEIENTVVCENPELIVSRFNEKKGVILLSAHFGNWEYIAMSVSSRIHIPFTVIVKPQRNPFVNDWMNKNRIKFENKIVSLGISIRNVYQELKNKNVVAMVADQRGPAEGTKLEFFGRKTSVYTGPAILSLKTGAPIIMGVPIRQKDYLYRTKLIEIDSQNLPDDYDGKVLELSKRHMNYLESVIKENPEQWFWMHKRWKH